MKHEEGKFYVRDMFPGGPGDPAETISGPFDTAEEAFAELDNVNIGGDCYVVKAGGKETSGRRTLTNVNRYEKA
jgi:hypothetical protein